MHAIVVAFGPASDTQQAVRRLKRISSIRSVWVVAANRHHVRALRGLMGAEIVETVGTSGVHEVVSQLGEDPVLLIHDDVYIGASGVARMLRVLDDGADLVAPHSNEVDTPQFLGALPAASEAASTVDRLTGLGDPRRIEAARYSCVLARASQLADLGGSMVIPGSSVVRTNAEIMLAPAAVAHDLSCNGKLVKAIGPEPVLVASMIVRDEEAQLPGALESLRGLVDRVEICDTGSTDATISLAEAAGANVQSIEWRNDFGWARNQALESCRDALYFLHLDADERAVVDDADLFRRWLATWSDELHGVSIELANYREHGESASHHRAMRIARAEGAYWVGALHESVRFDRAVEPRVAFYGGFRIDHFGYARSVVAAKGKAERNIGIARSAYESNPDLKHTIDLARSLSMEDPHSDEADGLFRDALARVGPDAVPTLRSYLFAMVGASDYQRGDVETGIELARQAISITPKEDVALSTLAHWLHSQDAAGDLVELWEDVSVRPSDPPMFGVLANTVRFRVLTAWALATVGRVAEAISLTKQGLADEPIIAAESALHVIPPLIAAGVDIEALAELVALDRTSAIIERIAASAAPPLTAQIALTALESGSQVSGVFVTGLAAALIRNEVALADRLMEFADVAEAAQREGLADMARRRDRSDLAERLEYSDRGQGWDLTLIG